MADRLAALVAVVLCVAALGVAAASLSASPLVERDSGEGSGAGVGEPPTGQSQSENATRRESPDAGLPPWLITRLLPLVLGLSLPTLLYLQGRHLLAVGTVLVLVMLVFVVFGGGPPPEPPTEAANSSAALGNESGGGPANSSSGGVSLTTVGAVVAALLTAAGLVAYASGGTDATDTLDTGDDGDDPDREAVAAAAGRAADDIESAVDRSNGVYEAWADMTDALDLPRETTTPQEFADAAVRAGVDPEDVTELTHLFETVRYGGADPSAERERHAVEALRRIEADLSGDDPTDGPDPDDGGVRQ